MSPLPTLLILVLGAAPPARGVTTRGTAPQDPAPASRPFRLSDAASRPVARVGAKEITVGEIVAAASTFFPAVSEELDSPYGKEFLESSAFDGWVDAFLDLTLLARDPRVAALMPPSPLLERAIEARARALAPRRFVKPNEAPPPVQTSEIERVRRFLGFDIAREVQLDALVRPIADATELRRRSLEAPWKLTSRLRMRHLLLPVRESPDRVRFPRARREGVLLDAVRLLERLRGGEPFASVAKQVRAGADLRSADTLPWVSYDAPLPRSVLRALFAAEKGAFVGPVETADGYFLALIEDRTIVPAGDFESYRVRLAEILRKDDQYDLLARLRSEVAVVVY